MKYLLNLFFITFSSIGFADTTTILNSKFLEELPVVPSEMCTIESELERRLRALREKWLIEIECPYTLTTNAGKTNVDFFNVDALVLFENSRSKLMKAAELPETIPFNEEKNIDLKENPEVKKLVHEKDLLFYGYRYPVTKSPLEDVKRFFTMGRVRKGKGAIIRDHISNDRNKMMNSIYNQTTETLYTAGTYSRKRNNNEEGAVLFIDPSGLEKSMLSVNRMGNVLKEVTYNAEEEILIYKVIPNKNFIGYYDRGSKTLALNCFNCSLNEILSTNSSIYKLVYNSFNCSSFESQKKLLIDLGMETYSEKIPMNDDLMKVILRKLFKEKVKNFRIKKS